MNRLFLAFFLLFFTLNITAREFVVRGRVMDKKDGTAISGVSLRLLHADSTLATGGVSDSLGLFRLHVDKEGNYLVRMAMVGYKPVICRVALTQLKDSADVGTVALEMSDYALHEAVVRGTAAKVYMKKDTFVYNASAYRVSEGAALESLVKKLPGVTVDDKGAIKLNGKDISQIKINGKDFFKGDTKIAMKNLPVSLVEQVRGYEEKSEYTKHTGVEDGDKKTVLDVKLKKELKSTLTSNGNIGVGTKHRYNSGLFANRFTDKSRQTLFGTMENVPDVTDEYGGFESGGGLYASKNFGLNMNWTNKEKYEAPGRVEINYGLNYDHNNTDMKSQSNSETFLGATTLKSFSNSMNQSQDRSSNYTGNADLRWNIDSVTYMNAGINLSMNKSNSWSTGQSASFNDDPYQWSDLVDPLSAMFSHQIDPRIQKIAVNTNLSNSLSDNKSYGAGANFFIVHKLDTLGQSITFNGSWNYNDSKSHSFDVSGLRYFQLQDSVPQSYYNQYTHTPSKSWGANAGVSYVYAFSKKFFLNAGYKFRYSYNNQDAMWYQLDSLHNYRDTHPLIGTLPTADSLAMVINLQNSQYSTYHEYYNTLSAGFRLISGKLNLSTNLALEPQTTKLNYKRGSIDRELKRNVFNFIPRIDMRYEFSDNKTLNVYYNASTSHPSMLNLLEITDNSNPLYVTKGNKDLKSSWSNNLSCSYNSYSQKHQRYVYLSSQFSQTFNSISNKITYVPATGGQISQPDNINGNWNASLNMSYGQSFGKDNKWSVNSYLGSNYSNNVGYVSTGSGATLSSSKNTMRSLGVFEYAMGSYRTDALDIGLGANVDYQHSRSSQQHNSNMDACTMIYRMQCRWTLPWKTELASDFNVRMRRGYADSQMNTNEYLWNASINQSFLKDRSLSLGFYIKDILHQKKNVTRDVSTYSRSETSTNSIDNYCLLRLVYKLNIFGGANGRG